MLEIAEEFNERVERRAMMRRERSESNLETSVVSRESTFGELHGLRVFIPVLISFPQHAAPSLRFSSRPLFLPLRCSMLPAMAGRSLAQVTDIYYLIFKNNYPCCNPSWRFCRFAAELGDAFFPSRSALFRLLNA